jgi:hypothetical protein
MYRAAEQFVVCYTPVSTRTGTQGRAYVLENAVLGSKE